MSNCGGCANARDRCGNGLEKIYPTTAVRYGKMGYIGEFAHEPDVAFTCGGKVVIQTDRGIEIGQQVSLTCNSCEKSVSRDQMRAYAKASGGDSYRLKNGYILREATAADLAELRHIEDAIWDKIAVCRPLVEQLNLPMKIVDAEHIFGGERIIFYFMSEDRIDFRELVRLLAREFQTRIEMRQVGARDEARLLADYETCGRECCCKSFLKTLKPVGMQMAKLQKATLDPSKVSGRCGRLKCCLRYEHESYADLNKKLPRVGRRVRTESEEGVVIDRQILTQLLKLRKDDGTLVTVCEEDLVERDLPNPPPQSGGGDAGPHGRSDRRRAESAGNDGNNRRERQGREGRGRGPANPPRQQVPRQDAPAEPFEEVEASLTSEEMALPDAPAEGADVTLPVIPPQQSNVTHGSPTPTDRPDESGRAAGRPDRPRSGPNRGGAPGSPNAQGNRRGRRRRRRGGGKGPSSPGGPPQNPA